MLTELEIQGFRCFPSLTAKPLGRVNLLVGKNNSGKTAFLDAVELVAWDEPAPRVFHGLVRRDELSWKSVEQGHGQLLNRFDLDVPNLFYGRSVAADASFRIRSGSRFVEALFLNEDGFIPRLELVIQTSAGRRSTALAAGYIFRVETTSSLDEFFARSRTQVLFLPTWRSDSVFLSQLWDEVLLTDDESLVVEAMKLVEPRVERIAFRGEGDDRNVAVRLKGDKQPRWLGSLGDGLRHMLALALHLVPAKDGYLLIDEIDTGLHYSVLAQMWRMVIESARRLNIQVFATTHSMDCIQALAEVHQQMKLLPEDLMLHRLEPDLGKTISYTPDEIVDAAQFHGEVR